jgi:hypothetical protein
MNERLKQLLGQAYDEAVPETWTTLSSEQLGRIYEKFAELIVRECARACEYNEAPSMLDQLTADQYALIAQGRKTAAYLVKQHFGVEE